MDVALRAAVEQVLGGRIADASRAPRGYTPAARWRVRLDDGRTAFVKAAVNDLTAGWLRDEQRVYAALRGPFLPRLLGWLDDRAQTLLVLEDLGGERWPPPWRPGDPELVRATLDRVHAASRPPGLRRASTLLAAEGWATVAADPRPFLSTGVVPEPWLEAALPLLLAAEATCEVDGDALVHLDVRSDNLCLRNDTAVLVDWNHASLGNGELDVAFWLPSLELEGGPRPEAILPEAGNAAAMVSGYFAARAGLPPVPDALGVRPIQLAQLRPALAWATRALGLRPLGAS